MSIVELGFCRRIKRTEDLRSKISTRQRRESGPVAASSVEHAEASANSGLLRTCTSAFEETGATRAGCRATGTEFRKS